MTKGAILITGGAGYIGSHVVLALTDAGRTPVVIDDLSTGRREAIPEGVPFYEGDIGNAALLEEAITKHKVSAVMHFAGAVVVPESVADPLKYYLQNTAKSRTLLQACIRVQIARFIFSSTAAVYGNSAGDFIAESAATVPANPYGRSKLMVEWMLADTAAAHDFSYAALRYFNVAGADPQGRTGQSTPGATHLIKIASEVAVGRREGMEIFGEDYDTADGTCIRDYIHVTDLAAAHLAALDHLEAGGESLTLNCGYGRGYSVREVLAAVAQEHGEPLSVRMAPRRPGDVGRLVADVTEIGRALSWKPRHDNLEEIVRSALSWEKRLVARTP